MQLSWPVFTGGLRYDLYSRTNLVEGSWSLISSTTSSNLTHAPSTDALFYRISVSADD